MYNEYNIDNKFGENCVRSFCNILPELHSLIELDISENNIVDENRELKKCINNCENDIIIDI